MKPTVIGGPIARVASLPMQSALPVPVSTGSIVLTEEQYRACEAEVAKLNFATMPTQDLITIGRGAEQRLSQTLDELLARIDRTSGARVFALFDSIERGVAEADLPDVLRRITDAANPGRLLAFMGKLRGKNPAEVARAAYEETQSIMRDRTRTLADKIRTLETDYAKEIARLIEELVALDTLQNAYRAHLGEFALAAAIGQAFTHRARAYVAAQAAEIDANDVLAQADLEELRRKLELLESRALALEGTYTRIPADLRSAQQIRQAGVATLQEATTSATTRFTNIKMTLLALHGALAVQGVQQRDARHALLDNQLASIRGAVTRQVVTTAATAPGDNREAQAAQITAIIGETREIQSLVANARAENERKFATARATFEAARRSLASVA